MQKLTLKQSIFLAVEMRSKFLQNVEPADRENGMGQRYAAFLLDRIIKTPETELFQWRVSYDLGYASAILIERRSATTDEIGELIAAAATFDMKITGAVNVRADKTDVTGAVTAKSG